MLTPPSRTWEDDFLDELDSERPTTGFYDEGTTSSGPPVSLSPRRHSITTENHPSPTAPSNATNTPVPPPLSGFHEGSALDDPNLVTRCESSVSVTAPNTSALTDSSISTTTQLQVEVNRLSLNDPAHSGSSVSRSSNASGARKPSSTRRQPIIAAQPTVVSENPALHPDPAPKRVTRPTRSRRA